MDSAKARLKREDERASHARAREAEAKVEAAGAQNERSRVSYRDEARLHASAVAMHEDAVWAQGRAIELNEAHVAHLREYDDRRRSRRLGVHGLWD